MERALQERVVGAIVLVIFIVLVVPVFLDGPATEPETVRETVVLPGQNGQPRKRQTIVLERDRTEPVPQQPAAGKRSEQAAAPPASRPLPVAKAPATSPVPQSVAPAEEPAEEIKPETPPADVPPAPKASSAATSSSGMWAVQLGSFSRKENADRLAQQLREKGYAAFLSQLESAGKPMHRVRIGPQKDRDSAQAVVARLAKDGQKGQVVPHP